MYLVPHYVLTFVRFAMNSTYIKLKSKIMFFLDPPLIGHNTGSRCNHRRSLPPRPRPPLPAPRNPCALSPNYLMNRHRHTLLTLRRRCRLCFLFATRGMTASPSSCYPEHGTPLSSAAPSPLAPSFSARARHHQSARLHCNRTTHYRAVPDNDLRCCAVCFDIRSHGQHHDNHRRDYATS